MKEHAQLMGHIHSVDAPAMDISGHKQIIQSFLSAAGSHGLWGGESEFDVELHEKRRKYNLVRHVREGDGHGRFRVLSLWRGKPLQTTCACCGEPPGGIFGLYLMVKPGKRSRSICLVFCAGCAGWIDSELKDTMALI